MNNKTQPIFKKQLPAGISAAVFERKHQDRIYRSVNLQRSYRKDGKWQRMTIYLDHEQIPFMIEALKGTWQFLNDHPIANVNGMNEISEPETDGNLDELAN